MANKYFVYILTGDERACLKYDLLRDALEKYGKTEMKKMHDNVFLGIEGDDEKDGYYCFDVVHKFFDDNILINDYLSHKNAKGIMDTVNEIINNMFIKYQWVAEITNGVLIDYESPFVDYEGKEIDPEWNEAHLSTYKDGEINIVGWVKPTGETINKYGWNFPLTASYIDLMNVTMYDERGRKHEIDIDPRVYLKLCGKRVSIKNDVEQ